MGSNKEKYGIITLNKPVDSAAEKAAQAVGGFVKLSDDSMLMLFDQECGGKWEAAEYLEGLIKAIAPLGYVLNGNLDCINTEYMTLYGVFVKNNKVKEKPASKVVYSSKATSKWNLAARVFKLTPFHMPGKLMEQLKKPKPLKKQYCGELYNRA